MTYQIHLQNETANQDAANAFPPFEPFPGFVPNPFRSSPAIHTPTHRLNWTNLWTRRRSFHSFNAPEHAREGGVHGRRQLMNPPSVNNISVGDVSLMAWPDNHWRYIFLSKNATAKSIVDGTWVGGYDTKSIDVAERYSYASFRTYRDLAPDEWKDKLQINSTYMGTCTGLTKMPYDPITSATYMITARVPVDRLRIRYTLVMPLSIMVVRSRYIRDGRRSLGVDDFVMTLNNTRTLLDADDCAAVVGHGADIWGHRMMEHVSPIMHTCESHLRAVDSCPDMVRHAAHRYTGEPRPVC